MLKFFNQEIAPLNARLGRLLYDRTPYATEQIKDVHEPKQKHIELKRMANGNTMLTITKRNKTSVFVLTSADMDELLSFDWERGVLGEQAFDPGEAPF